MLKNYNQNCRMGLFKSLNKVLNKLFLNSQGLRNRLFKRKIMTMKMKKNKTKNKMKMEMKMKKKMRIMGIMMKEATQIIITINKMAN